MKKFIIHFLGWIIVYGFFGWAIDVTRFSEQTTTSHILILVAISIFMAFVTMGKFKR
tara:strand:- start:334 stop:504 length:171 start_codon:yes stop_codon:yes gene_type:complete